MNLAKNVKVMPLKIDGTNYTAAAGTTDLTSEAIDTQGYEGVMIVTHFGAITSGAVTSVKAQQCDTSGGTYADLEGTGITVADDDDSQATVIDVYRPRERYVKQVIDRGTQNAVINGAVAILYGPREMPVVQDATLIVAAECHASPAEGTA